MALGTVLLSRHDEVMRELERVLSELTRLTERLRKVNNRKGAGAMVVRHHRSGTTTSRPSITSQRRMRRIS